VQAHVQLARQHREVQRALNLLEQRGVSGDLARRVHEHELTVVLAPSEAGGAREGTVEVFTARGRDEGDELSCGKRTCSDQEAYKGAPTEDRTDLECQAEAVASAPVEQHAQDDQLELRQLWTQARVHERATPRIRHALDVRPSLEELTHRLHLAEASGNHEQRIAVLVEAVNGTEAVDACGKR
jgi:hypothetical protein